jgi:predicted nucleic-acid-binding protein
VAEALDLLPLCRADFVDLLVDVLNRRTGCATTYTFDRAAAATANFTAVA